MVPSERTAFIRSFDCPTCGAKQGDPCIIPKFICGDRVKIALIKAAANLDKLLGLPK